MCMHATLHEQYRVGQKVKPIYFTKMMLITLNMYRKLEKW